MLLFFYIVKELIFPMVLSLGVTSTVLMMNQLFEFIPFLQSAGVEIGVIGQMIFYNLPTVLMVTVPTSLLIGVYAGIARLSGDSELIVMRASGISLSYFIRPVLLVATVAALFIMMFSFYLSPIGVKNMAILKYNILKKQTRLNLQVRQINNFFGQKLIYMFDKKDDLFEGIFISDWDLDRHSDVIEAKTGKIFLDDKQHRIVFKLYNGKIHTVLDDEGYRVIEFESLDYALTPPKTSDKHIPHRFRNEFEEDFKKMDTELMIHELLAEIKSAKKDTSDYYEYVEEVHGRIVTVLSSICFALFALPMGIFNPRSPKTGNIIYMISVLIVYYFAYARIRNLLANGETSPAVLYAILLFILGNAMLKYLKVNLNIDSFFKFALDKIRKPKAVTYNS